MIAYINSHAQRENGIKDSFLTISAPVKNEPLPWQLLGLQFTRSGYGSRIPTQYKVKYFGKWRRVYCHIYSNIGTLYIGKLSDNLIININKG